jgi:hypothetical protein
VSSPWRERERGALNDEDQKQREKGALNGEDQKPIRLTTARYPGKVSQRGRRGGARGTLPMPSREVKARKTKVKVGGNLNGTSLPTESSDSPSSARRLFRSSFFASGDLSLVHSRAPACVLAKSCSRSGVSD